MNAAFEISIPDEVFERMKQEILNEVREEIAQINRANCVYTVQQLADYLGINVGTAYRLIQQDQLPATKIGHKWKISKKEVDRWLEENGKWKSHISTAI